MSAPFLAEIKIISWNFAPQGWAFCNGQSLPINQNQALFALLGTTYGGNGTTTFALPDLRSRSPVHFGNGIVLGERAGEEAHTLTIPELPAHLHSVQGNSAAVNIGSPIGNTWGDSGVSNAYSNTSDAAMNPAAVSTVGGSQPHTNMPPYLVLNFVIALQGIFPSRN